MPEQCGNIKAVLEDIQGKGLSSTAKLVAILEACGITDREEVETLLEVKASTLREAKAALKNQRQNSSTARNPAPEIQRCAGNTAQTPEIQRQNSSAPSRARATKESLRDTSLKDSSSCQSGDPTELMIDDVLSFMGPIANRREAAKWLTGTIAAYGHERTARAWTTITAKRAAREIMPNPLALWSKTAGGMKPGAEAQKPADVIPFKVTVAMHPNARPRDEVEAAHA